MEDGNGDVLTEDRFDSQVKSLSLGLGRHEYVGRRQVRIEREDKRPSHLPLRGEKGGARGC